MIFLRVAQMTYILSNARWMQDGMTVAGGYGEGKALNQLAAPNSFCVDDRNGTVFVADTGNHRIMEWKEGDNTGRLVIGENGQGNRVDQLNGPTQVLLDKGNNCLIICDHGNRRVMRWSLQDGTTHGQVIIDNIRCYGLAMDNEGHLYVTDEEKDEVRRYGRGDQKGTLVAGGNGAGDFLNQLNSPTHVYVDDEGVVYVSDSNNHRVMKWVKDATEGIIVAGGRGDGRDLTRLSDPQGVFVTANGTVYVAEVGNNRVTRWRKGMAKSETIVGGNGRGERANQFYWPKSLSFDHHGHLYIADWGNHRVQRFHIVKGT